MEARAVRLVYFVFHLVLEKTSKISKFPGSCSQFTSTSFFVTQPAAGFCNLYDMFHAIPTSQEEYMNSLFCACIKALKKGAGFPLNENFVPALGVLKANGHFGAL